VIRIEPPTRFPRFAPFLFFTFLCAVSAHTASAQDGIRSLAELENADVRFQPPSFRLEAMGGLGLAVRDTYTQINLWDFAGLPLGLATARDSTSMDLWVNGVGRTLDERAGGISYDVDRQHDSQYALEAVARSGNLAVGADAGSFAFRRGAPYGDKAHVTNNGNQPALVPVATGKLGGPLHWGLRGIVAKETFHRQLWQDQVEGGEVKLQPTGEQLAPPNFFTPKDITTPVYGLGASLGWFHGKKWEAGSYFDYRRENVEGTLSTLRSDYNTTESRDIWGYGAAAIVHPVTGTQVGVDAGRERYASIQNYRFTLSGGSVDNAFTGRGEREQHNARHDYFNVRVQSDLSSVPVTIGAAYRVSFDHDQIHATSGHPSDFNTFVTERVTSDTLQAPPLVVSGITETRGVEFGGGASYRFLERKATVGAEYRHFRDALNGDFVLAKATGWEARAGGEYQVHKHVVVRAGYRHHSEDQDVNSPRNELVADRVTFGAQYASWKHWTAEAYGYHEWWRTDYPDPLELGGPGTGLGLTFHRLF
jgi:hypothetical protein